MKRKSTKSNPHHGSSFEAFLEEEGHLEEATAKAIKRIMTWQLQQAMKERKVSKAALAKRMKTSRSQLDRILHPANDQVSLASLVKTAHAVGKRIRLELEEAA
jgi:predicted XRE-type DNA-binding protein